MPSEYHPKIQPKILDTDPMHYNASYKAPEPPQLPKRRKIKKPAKRVYKEGEFRQGTIRVCICGCGEEYPAYRDSQRFKSGHYKSQYGMHKCPDCGYMHINKKEKESDTSISS